MTSPTVRSPRSSTERSIAFSAGTASSDWPSPCSSMAPRRTSACSSISGVRSTCTPISLRKKRETQATPRAIGPRIARVTTIDGARISATRSARSSAQVLGITSAKITTITPTMIVA